MNFLVVGAILLGLLVLGIVVRFIMYDRVVILSPHTDVDANTNKSEAHWLSELFKLVIMNRHYQIEGDYEHKQISYFPSYNIGCLRRFPWCNGHIAHVRLAKLGANMHVLDLGCGVGNFAVYACLQFMGIHVTCVTNSQKLCEEVRSNALSAGVSDRVSVLCEDFDTWTPPEKTFDRVVSLEALGYSTNRPVLLRKLYDSLVEGGVIYIKTPTFRNPVRPNGVTWGQAAQLIGIWQYDFSTPRTILCDMTTTGFSSCESSSYSLVRNCIFANPIDIWAVLRFYFANGLRFRDHSVNLNPWHPLQVTHIRGYK
jgi:2-polyprenyl-3-methyl-5-hydroxy-6-metoxy-1,4-benzoquinol methylase